MRAILLLAVGLSVALAGCSDEETPPEGTPTGTATPTATATPTTTPTNTTPTTPPPPPKPAPVEACTINNDYTPGPPEPDPSDPTGATTPPPTTSDCAIPAGYRTVYMNATWANTAQGGALAANNNIGLRLLAPDGTTAVVVCTGPPASGPNPAPTPCAIEGPLPDDMGGAYKVEYSGSGTWTVTGTVTVVA